MRACSRKTTSSLVSQRTTPSPMPLPPPFYSTFQATSSLMPLPSNFFSTLRNGLPAQSTLDFFYYLFLFLTSVRPLIPTVFLFFFFILFHPPLSIQPTFTSSNPPSVHPTLPPFHLPPQTCVERSNTYLQSLWRTNCLTTTLASESLSICELSFNSNTNNNNNNNNNKNNNFYYYYNYYCRCC